MRKFHALSKSAQYKRKKRAAVLGVDVDDVPDPRGHHRNHPKGQEAWQWNDGRIISSHGYVKIRVGKVHPLADPNGYAYEHLIVWVSAGRESPAQNEILHHANENKQDNRLDNLEKKTRPRHGIDHFSNTTDEQISEIRKRYRDGETQKSIADSFNIPHQRVSKIVRGVVRRDAGGPVTTGDNRRGRTWDEVPSL